MKKQRVKLPRRDGMNRFWRLNGSGLEETGSGATLSTSNVTYKTTYRGYQSQCGVFNGTSSSATHGTTISGVLTTMMAIYPTAHTKTVMSATGITITINSSTQIETSGLTGVTAYVNGIQTNALTLNAWNFVVLTHDSANFASFNFGASSFAGDAQDVGTFTRAIGIEAIRDWYEEFLRYLGGASLYGLTDGLVAYFDFKGDANDIIGGNNGTVTGATLTTDRFGTANSAYSFDGVNDSITFTHPLLGATSYETWIKIDNTAKTNQFPIIGCYGTGALYLSYNHLTANQLTAANFNGTSDRKIDCGSLTQGQWYHLVLTRDSAGNGIVYRDGSQIATGALWTTTTSATGAFGGASGVFGQFTSQYGKIYNRALSAAEVKALYELSSKTKLLPFS